MNGMTDQTPVAQIVLDYPECAGVLQKHRIDYCCKGELPLAEACRQRGAPLPTVLSELEQAISQRRQASQHDPRNLSTEGLVGHIVRRHHRFLRDALPFLVPLAKKVARVHGAHNAHLLDVRDLVEQLADELLPHLDHEEQELFPALTGDVNATPDVIAKELATMHADHLEVARLLEALRNAAHDFVIPEGACASYTTLFKELPALEADVFEHVHLENHVLMPRFAAQGGAR